MADHLAGDYEVEIVGLHPIAGLSDHVRLAVQAGVEIRTVAVFRIKYDLLVFLDDIDDVEFDTQSFCDPQGVVALGAAAILIANRMRMAFDF